MPVGAVQFKVHPVVVIFDEVNPVGAAGKLVDVTALDIAEDALALFACAVMMYTVFASKPVIVPVVPVVPVTVAGCPFAKKL